MSSFTPFSQPRNFRNSEASRKSCCRGRGRRGEESRLLLSWSHHVLVRLFWAGLLGLYAGGWSRSRQNHGIHPPACWTKMMTCPRAGRQRRSWPRYQDVLSLPTSRAAQCYNSKMLFSDHHSWQTGGRRTWDERLGSHAGSAPLSQSCRGSVCAQPAVEADCLHRA
jgi:hypothetical protein